MSPAEAAGLINAVVAGCSNIKLTLPAAPSGGGGGGGGFIGGGGGGFIGGGGHPGWWHQLQEFLDWIDSIPIGPTAL